MALLLQLDKSDDLKVHFNPEITPQTDRNSLQVDRWLGGLTSAFDNNRRSLVFPPSIESSQSVPAYLLLIDIQVTKSVTLG